jgi:uncharacterized protein
MDYQGIQSINLARLLREGGTAEASGQIEKEVRAEEVAVALEGTAQWKVTAVSVGDNELWLSGEVAGQAILECRRCLEFTPTPVGAHFQSMLRYQPGAEGIEIIEEDKEEVFVFGSPNLDLSPFLSEAFLLEVPYSTLCKEDCLGLCPVCGSNRNKTDCGHQAEKPSKLAGLKHLLEGLEP